MKKRGLLFISILLLTTLALLCSGCGGSTDTQSSGKQAKDDSKPIELNFAGFFPPASPFQQTIMPALIEEIETTTDGRVKIINYPGGTLLEGGKIFDGVASGAADMGHDSLSWIGDRLPISYMFELSGLPFTSGKSASRTFSEVMETINPEEFKDVKPLMFFATGPGHIISTVPIRNMADMKGKQIRCIQGHSAAISLLGGTPISMTHAESYEALQKGVVQGNLASLETLQSYKLAEVTDYITVTPFLYNGCQAIFMNLNTWNSLPEDIQKAIEGACDKVWEEQIMGYFDNSVVGSLKYAQEQSDIEFIYLSEEEEALWKETIANILGDYAKDLDAKGLPGTDAYNLLFELGEKYNQMYEDPLVTAGIK